MGRLIDFVVDQLLADPNAKSTNLKAARKVNFDSSFALFRINRCWQGEVHESIDIEPTDLAPHADARNVDRLTKPPAGIAKLQFHGRTDLHETIQERAFSQLGMFAENTGLKRCFGGDRVRINDWNAFACLNRNGEVGSSSYDVFAPTAQLREGRPMRSPIAAILLALIPTMCSAQDAELLVTEQWNSVDATGGLRAMILKPFGGESTEGGDARVSLVTANGSVIAAEPDLNSQTALMFSGVPAGTHTLVARGPGMVAVYAVHIVEGVAQRPGETLHISPANLDLATVRTTASRYLPAKASFEPSFDVTAGEAVMKTARRDRLTRIQQDGAGFKGRVYRAGMDGNSLAAGGENNVLIYQDGELVTLAVTDTDGAFKIDQLVPGSYAILIAGPDGFAVTGFELVDENDPGIDAIEIDSVKAKSPGQTFVAAQVPPTQPEFQIQLAAIGLQSPAFDLLMSSGSSGDSDAQPSDVSPEEPIGLPLTEVSPMSGAPVGAGGGGIGGGGVGGGGGLGGVAALGVIGAGIAIATSDDDGAIVTPSIASPATP